MVIFSLKLLNNLRKAIAGRKFPHQLAGGVALGVLLGVIPHGNLLALVVLIAVLCFRVNHAMVGVVAILVSFGATRLDDYSHSVGKYVLTHPQGNEIATAAYALPLVPWMDINNTVVLGSFLIGTAAVLPVFLLTLPLFRMVAPAAEAEPAATEASTETEDQIGQPRQMNVATIDDQPTSLDFAPIEVPPATGSRHSVALIDVAHDEPVLPPRYSDDGSGKPNAGSEPMVVPIDQVLASQTDFVSPRRVDAAATSIETDALPTSDEMVSVETKIDIIRMNDYRPEQTGDHSNGQSNEADSAEANNASADRTGQETEQPMDEALSYLLRQLRHSQQRKAG